MSRHAAALAILLVALCLMAGCSGPITGSTPTPTPMPSGMAM